MSGSDPDVLEQRGLPLNLPNVPSDLASLERELGRLLHTEAAAQRPFRAEGPPEPFLFSLPISFSCGTPPPGSMSADPDSRTNRGSKSKIKV